MGSGRRFLVIDDSPVMRRIIVNMLQRLGYADIVTAGNGREALERLRAAPVDAVITDWAMPEMNGLELIRLLRSGPETSYLPVIVVTGNGSLVDVKRAMDCGVSAYLLKPFTVDVFREKVASLSSYMETYRPLGHN